MTIRAADETQQGRSFPVSVSAQAMWPMLAVAGWYLALSGTGWVVGFEEHTGILMTVGVVSAVLTSALMVKLAAGRKGVLVVSRDAVVLGSRSVPRAGIRVSVVVWKQPHLHTGLGTALDLAGPTERLVLGAVTEVPPRRSLPAVTGVDACLSSADFAELSRLLGVEKELGRAPGEGVEIDLVPSRTGFAGAFRSIAPWLATMGLAGGVGVVGSALGFETSMSGMAVMSAVSIAIVVAGLVYTFRRSTASPAVRYRLQLGSAGVSLVDARAGAGASSLRVAPTRVTRVTFRYSTRFGTYEFPALRLDWAAGRPMVVGVWDTAHGWGTPTERTRRVDYLVGPAEWRLVLDALSDSRASGARLEGTP